MLIAVVLALPGVLCWAEEPVEKQTDQTGAKVQLAILLDTSSSMSGLIDQARTNLWKVVNRFIDSELAGKRPQLEVALLEYGAGRLSEEQGYTRLVVPLSSDLDKLYEELMALTAVGRPGGSLEHCGQIIDLAINKLEWSTSNRDLKCIFIAGNEEFTQGPVDFRAACRAAANRGVTISTIFCGDRAEGVRLLWEEAAKLADGSYLWIDQNEVAPPVATPQDKGLAELNEALNKTYLPYGRQELRQAATRRQLEGDAAAAALAPAASAERAQFKGSDLYRNESWDLVDAIRGKKVKLEDLNEDELPDALRKLTPEKRRQHVDELTRQRDNLQTEIEKLSQQRQQFLSDLAKQNADRRPAAEALGGALIEAVQDQAEKKDVRLKP
jgi:hypothetical protein